MPEQGFTQFLGSFFGGFNFQSILLIAGAVLFTCIIIGVIIWFVYNRLQWNLRVEFKLTRASGNFIGAEWGKGSFNSKRGVVYVKRPKFKKVAMKPFDVKEYLQGDNILTVEQIGVDTYLPVHPTSFETMIDEKYNKKTGRYEQVKVSLMNLKSDTGESKSWKNSYEREAKSAYAVTNFLKEHGALLAMGLVLFMNFIGFGILWMKLKPSG